MCVGARISRAGLVIEGVIGEPERLIGVRIDVSHMCVVQLRRHPSLEVGYRANQPYISVPA